MYVRQLLDFEKSIRVVHVQQSQTLGLSLTQPCMGKQNSISLAGPDATTMPNLVFVSVPAATFSYVSFRTSKSICLHWYIPVPASIPVPALTCVS